VTAVQRRPPPPAIPTSIALAAAAALVGWGSVVALDVGPAWQVPATLLVTTLVPGISLVGLGHRRPLASALSAIVTTSVAVSILAGTVLVWLHATGAGTSTAMIGALSAPGLAVQIWRAGWGGGA